MSTRTFRLGPVVALVLLALAGCDVVQKPAPPPPVAPVAQPTLREAVLRGDRARVQELLEGGADRASADAEHRTPLHHAARLGYREIVELLAQPPAVLEARDLQGATPLHLAARYGHLAAVQALLEAGAEVLARDQQNRTAYDLARVEQHPEVADYLVEHGGGPIPEPEAPPVVEPPPVDLVVPRLTGDTFRIWTSLSGTQLEAEFVNTQFDVVQLRKTDASLVRIRLDLLKPEDQMLVRQLAGSAPPRLVRNRATTRTDAADQDSLGLRIGRDKGWTVLTDCRLLSNPANDGDSFHVRHEGKEYIFRLYYVDSPETDAAFPDRVQEQAEYFHFREQDALRVGQEAKKFTERILSAAPFTVVTKWEDARGNSQLPRHYAFVITPQGDLDELLAAEGLVRLYGMHVADNLGDKKQGDLKQLEQEARRDRLGAWGFDQRAEVKP